MGLIARYFYGNSCYDDYGDYNCSSGWETWGRWVLLAVIIVVALLVFFLFSCLSARRRRARGYNPYWGTTWASGRHGQPTYNAQPYYSNQQTQPHYDNNNNAAAPPAYPGREVELQQPTAAYKPPEGPPPGR